MALIAQAGLHCGFGDVLGPEVLAQVRAQGFTVVRLTSNRPDAANKHHALNMATPEHCRALAQEVIDAGLQPLLSVVRADQVAVVPFGTLVEAGNEPDIKMFGWSRDQYASEAVAIAHACEARQLKCYLGAISNPINRGFRLLEAIPWASLPPASVACSIHWYPPGNHSRRGHERRSRERELSKVREVVGGRPIAVTETGFSLAEWTLEEQADCYAAERRFWSSQDVELVVAYQLNDGAEGDTARDSNYGARHRDGTWKPWVRAFVEAV